VLKQVIALLLVSSACTLFVGAENCRCNTPKHEAELQAKLRLDTHKFGANSEKVAVDSLELAKFYSRRGDRKRSAHYLGVPRKNRKTASDAAAQTARNYMIDKRYADAQANAAEAVKLSLHPLQKAQAFGVLGWSLSEQKKNTEAIAAYQSALKLRKQAAKTPEEIEETSMQMQQLASVYQRAQQPEKSKATLVDAAKEMERAHGPEHALTKLVRQMAGLP
jgi:tetratricopeptide (TPR) repeat protein